MSGKSIMEKVWGTLLVVCVAFVTGLVLFCFVGMFTRDLLKFLCFGVIVAVIGLSLIELCANALASAEKSRINRGKTVKRCGDMNVYIEGGNAYYNTDGTITVQAIPEELSKLRKENAALQHLIRQSEATAQEAKRELTVATRKYYDDCRQYKHLLDAARAEVKAQEKAYREQREIDHLERMELWAWRKTEKARKKRDARLRARVKKIRKQMKVNTAIAGDENYAIAAKTERECAIAPDRLEVSNAIIALAEYLRPYNPTEEFQTYLWDCRTVQALLDDMRESVVRTAFGHDWEALLLAGLIGLHIIETPPFTSIADPASVDGVTAVRSV